MKLENLKKSELISMLKEVASYNDVTSIHSFKDAVDQLVLSVTNWKQEQFICIYLNGANNVISTKIIFKGTLNSSIVHPREVFAPAYELRAASIIIAHNHPSGNLHPSESDIAVTKRLLEVSKILGIDVLDHIIFRADSKCYSFKKECNLI